MLAVASVAVVSAPQNVSTAAPASTSTAEVIAPRPTYTIQNEIRDRVNYFRRRIGIAPVALQWQLNQAAQTHANDMAKRRYMSHVGSDGSSAGTRISRTGYRWWIWGENVAAGQTTGYQVVVSWYNSAPHRAIMLDRRYIHVGVGRAVASDGTIYWCLVMASPM